MRDESDRHEEVVVEWDSRKYVEKENAFVDIFDLLPLDVPLDGPQRDRMKAYLRKSVMAISQHWHSFTCKKNGCEGTDESCRLEYIRMLVNISHVLSDDVSFVIRRTRGNIVPYIRALMLACPGNHTMSVFVEASRWFRKRYLWRREHPDASEVRSFLIPCMRKHFHYYKQTFDKVCDPLLFHQGSPEEPQLPEPHMAAATGTEYVSGYNFKNADSGRPNRNVVIAALDMFRASGKTEMQVSK